jgi:hypothetical protein
MWGVAAPLAPWYYPDVILFNFSDWIARSSLRISIESNQQISGKYDKVFWTELWHVRYPMERGNQAITR